MGIYIPGMEMPKDSYYIDIRLFSDGWAHISTDEPPYYNKAFEAFELPPHGRLIDANALCDRLLTAWDVADKEKKTLISAVMADVVTPIVIGTPTIIPADDTERGNK